MVTAYHATPQRKGCITHNKYISPLFSPSHHPSRSLVINHASLVDINRRLRDDWGRVRYWCVKIIWI